jgi:hypothetical protein
VYLQYRQHNRIISGAKGKRSTRIASLRRTLQQNSRRCDITFGNELLAAAYEGVKLLAIEL